MLVYCTSYVPTDRTEALAALMPPARRRRLAPGHTGPLFAYALAALALEREYGVDAASGIRYTEGGKPYIDGAPVHLSISHAKTHALCALDSRPVGADIENHREISGRVADRTLAPGEASDHFFDHWVLKESYIKLNDAPGRPFRTLPFTITGDLAEGNGAHGHLLRDIPGCSAAVLSHHPFPAPGLTLVPGGALVEYAKKKRA